MRNFVINFKFVLETLWLHFLRGEKWKAFLQVVGNDLQKTNIQFVSSVTATRELYLYSSQKIYLEKRLNDLYDPIDRNIYVEKKSLDRDLVTYQNSEYGVAYLYQNSEPNVVYMFQNSDIANQINYTVHCPYSTSSSEANIKDLLNTYKQSGTNYELLFDL